MPRLAVTSDDQVINIPGPGNFQFSSVRIEKLGATEYTLVTIVCDISGSVKDFAPKLLTTIKTIIEACKKSPRADNLLLRILHFNSEIYEIHGFKELQMIDVNKYEDLEPESITALFDATYDAVGATVEFSRQLIDQDFECNGAIYVITDGLNNCGSMTENSIKDKIQNALRNEHIESLITILIGLHDPNVKWGADVEKALTDFKNDAALTKFINVGDATAQRLAKLADWVENSVSSQSQSLGTGGPSQVLAF